MHLSSRKEFIPPEAMNTTRISLLRRVTDGNDFAWSELVSLYQPIIQSWLQRQGIDRQDAEEISQNVFVVVVSKIDSFKHSGQTGAFRTWLRRITAFQIKSYWRSGKFRPQSVGGSRFVEIVHDLEDETSELAQEWERQHDDFILNILLERLKERIGPTTVAAFKRLVLNGDSPEGVAFDLNMTIGAVYSAKSRVLRRLREESRNFVASSCFS